MDPITLILLGIGSLLAGGAAAAVVYIAFLTIDTVMSWFQARRSLLRGRNLIAATIMERLSTGRYRTVQGVFNTQTQGWLESRTIESDQVSADLASRHYGRDVAVYTV
ncbi:hypothetical protein [Phytohabitans rumicis]|uniref:Uncharacterized protein n=1 Tax=Phytohabitans rumicis TaxID=1076125 RepID=A0A6V8LG05_9ACTN|nr:hypothetical protein [Phytohabitans rumicis]GFJ92997.1 hypothetical protein Prum_066390 [Phytohabitans rumicis]